MVSYSQTCVLSINIQLNTLISQNIPRVLHSFGTLHSVYWWLVTYILGHCPELSISNHQSTLCNIPEEQRPHLLCGRNLNLFCVILSPTCCGLDQGIIRETKYNICKCTTNWRVLNMHTRCCGVKYRFCSVFISVYLYMSSSSD
jgi:hypothetical protein